MLGSQRNLQTHLGGCFMSMRDTLAAVTAITTITFAQTLSTLAAPCPKSDAKLTIKNTSGHLLKSILAVHRVGKAGDDAQARAWANLADNASSVPVDITFVSSVKHSSLVDFDWWTVFYSYERTVGGDAQGKPIVADVVFRLDPKNGQKQLDDIAATLQSSISTIGPAELKAITSANPLSPFLAPLVDPAFKLLATVLIRKGASLD